MLKMLTCDKFRKDINTGLPERIYFQKGLNVVKGTADSKNSIGKSTLLLLIDFAFGGEDYENHCNIAVNAIGEHAIFFTLEVDGNDYHYGRSTKNPERVLKYSNDDFRESIGNIGIQEYLLELHNIYKLPNDITFRQMISPYLRIYQRQTTNEKTPLNAAFSESMESAIGNHLKLYGVYDDLNSIINERDTLEDDVKTYRKSGEYKYIRKINKDDYEQNLKEIEEKTLELEGLKKQYEERKYDAQSYKKLEESSIVATLSELKFQKDNLESRLARIETLSNVNMDRFQENLRELEEYFEGVNFRKIEEAQGFHQEITSIFNTQAKKERSKIQKEIKLLEDKIAVYEEKYKEINHIETVPEAVFRQHYDLSKRIADMKEENKKFDEYEKKNELFKEKKEEVVGKSKELLSNLQDKINSGLEELNTHFYNGQVKAPKISFMGIDKRYNFYTPKDEGTGTSQKGAILFDLVTLNNTFLPLVVHDTVLLRHIEDYTLQEIIKLYSQEKDKQIIIAFDGEREIDCDAKTIIDSNTRIELGSGNRALFGQEFNK